MHKHVSTVRNMPILFYEQAVYGRGTKMEKVLLDHSQVAFMFH